MWLKYAQFCTTVYSSSKVKVGVYDGWPKLEDIIKKNKYRGGIGVVRGILYFSIIKEIYIKYKIKRKSCCA